MRPRFEALGGVFTSRTKSLQLDMDRYFSMIDEGVLMLQEGIKRYLEERIDEFELKSHEIDVVEHEADKLRRQIKHRLYSEMLIPDSRGDVLGLLETLDNVLDDTKHVMTQFSIEKPQIPPFIREDFRELVEVTVKSVLELTLAVRAFFREVYRVTEHLDKVHFWEHEADKIEQRLKRSVFSSDEIELLSERVHLRYFAGRLSRVADQAEDVAERLAVYAIKRHM